MTHLTPAVRAPEPTYVLGPRHDVHVVRIGARLLVGPGHYPGGQSCVARTVKGRRCNNPIEYSQAGPWERVVVPGWGEVSVMGLGEDDDELSRQWLAQRCSTHWGGDRPDAATPEWVAFDPNTHAELREEMPTVLVYEWTPDHGVALVRRALGDHLPTWPDAPSRSVRTVKIQGPST